MTDQSFDPWKSLAEDLGVQPTQDSPRPASPSPATPQVTSAHRTPPAASSPPKKSADWGALANELGLQPPPREETKPAAHDPVAELLGFPAPNTLQPPQGQDARPKYRDSETDFEEDDFIDWRSSRGRGAQEDQAEFEPPTRARDDFASDTTDTPAEPPRVRDGAGEERIYRPSRRRGRRGRGRGRAEGQQSEQGTPRSGNRDADRPENYRSGRQDRPERYGERGEERKPSENLRDESEFTPEFDDEFADGIIPADDLSAQRDAGPADGSRRPAARDEEDGEPRRKRGRRRGRRGRGQRGRDDRAQQTSESQESASGVGKSDDLDADLGFGDESDELDTYGATPRHEPRHSDPLDDESTDEMSGGHHDEDTEESHGKNSVRDIMTWKEAVGIIVESNLQSRSRAPQANGGAPHLSRGGRGRGRGRGRGPGRGNHRS